MKKYYIIIFLVLLIYCNAFSQENDNKESWMYLGNYQRNPIYHTKPIEKFTEIAWKFETENKEHILGQPLVYKGLVICKTRTTIYCLNIHDGSIVWKKEEFFALSYTTPVVDKETLLIVGVDKFPLLEETKGISYGYLYAINIISGKIIWKVNIESTSLSSPLVYNNIVYFGDVIGNFYAIDIINQTIKWQIKREYEEGEENHGFGTPCIYNNRIYVNLSSATSVSEKQHMIYCFDINTGKDVFNNFYKYNSTVFTINNKIAYLPFYVFDEKYALIRLLDLDTFVEVKQKKTKSENTKIGDELSSMAIITKDRIYAISIGHDTRRL